MAIIMEAVASELTQIQAYDAFSELKYGGNGDLYGSPELSTGVSADSYDSSRIAWDGNIFDGIESAWLDLEMTFDANGVAWSIGNSVVSHAVGLFSAIENIKIRAAAVDAQAGIFFDSMEVSFFKNGQKTDSASVGNRAQVDRTDTSDWGVSEKIVTVTPDSNDNDAVHISARVKLVCPEGVYLEENSLFGQVFIDAA